MLVEFIVVMFSFVGISGAETEYIQHTLTVYNTMTAFRGVYLQCEPAALLECLANHKQLIWICYTRSGPLNLVEYGS